MIDIPILETLNKEIEKFIKDDCVKRELGCESVQDFVVESIEGQLAADREVVLMD
jgi:hypothetical protein